MPDYEINSGGETFKVTGAGSLDAARGAVANQQMGDAMTGAAFAWVAIFMAIVLFVPKILVRIFEFVLKWLIAFGTVGRAIQSAVVGLISGFSVLILWHALDDRNPFEGVAWEGTNLVLWIMGIVIFFGLTTLWNYYSHYYTLMGRFFLKMEKGVFTKPFTVLFYGLIVVWILTGFNSWIRDYGTWIPTIAAFLLYAKGSWSARGVAKEAKKNGIGDFEIGELIRIVKESFKKDGAEPAQTEDAPKKAASKPNPVFTTAGAAAAVFLACIIPIKMSLGGAEHQALIRDVKGADLTGQTLTVRIAYPLNAVNLRAEASGTSKIIKTLNKDETVTGTGSMSGFWVPVQSGDDNGFVLSPFLDYRDRNLSLRFEAEVPFKAVATAPIQLYTDIATSTEKRARNLSKGDTATILRLPYAGTMSVEIGNQVYGAMPDAAENFVSCLNTDGSFVKLPTEKPSGFPKKTPFEAVVTEAIEATANKSRVSIPAGAKVTVTGQHGSDGIWRANVTYNGQEHIYIHWQYLKPAS